MAVLLDASVLIALPRGALGACIAERSDQEFHISVMTIAQLTEAGRRALVPSERARRLAFVEAIMMEFPIIPVDLLTARSFAHLESDLGTGSAPLQSTDLWLAATCIAHGLALATLRPMGLDRVPGLIVDVWATQPS